MAVAVVRRWTVDAILEEKSLPRAEIDEDDVDDGVDVEGRAKGKGMESLILGEMESGGVGMM